MVFKMKNILNHIFFFVIMVGVAGGEGYVSFSGKSMSVSCGNEDWVPSNGTKEETENQMIFGYEENKYDKIFCWSKVEDDKPTKLKFFIKARVCEKCIELDGILVAAVIFADLLITGGIILVVYAYGQRKSGPATPKPTNARNPAGSGGPPVPSPDYQPLSDFTRNRDTYATVHKTG